MAKVSQEMVRNAGVNIDELIDLLVKNAGAGSPPIPLVRRVVR